jgi:hypothetical protein
MPTENDLLGAFEIQRKNSSSAIAALLIAILPAFSFLSSLLRRFSSQLKNSIQTPGILVEGCQ